MEYDVDTKRNSIACGWEFLGTALLQLDKRSSSDVENLGCLLLNLAEYAQILDKEQA